MENEIVEFDIVVIGAGVIGLAVVHELSSRFNGQKTIAVLEKHFKFGQETSSRNSEVVHAGIYYNDTPLKAHHCLRGKPLLYEFCQKYDVPIQKCGKFVVADSVDKLPALEKIFKTAQSRDVEMYSLDGPEIRVKAQNSNLVSGLFSPTTGIVDSHVLMNTFEALSLSNEAYFLYQHEFVQYREFSNGFHLFTARDSTGAKTNVRCRVLVNAAGLAADRVYNGIYRTEKYKTKGCRGRYFTLDAKYRGRYQQLIYPLPDPAGGLGVHITMDLGGDVRLGPDVDWSFSETHSADDWALYAFDKDDRKLREAFFHSGRKLIPDLQESDLNEGYIGVRPKIYVDGVLEKDFVIHKGKQNDIHLLGIESPGLTAALSIAPEVAGVVAEWIS